MKKFYFLLLIFILFEIKDFKSQEKNPISKEQKNRINKYEKLVVKLKKENKKNQVANNLNKIAFIYWDTENFDIALKYFEKSLIINKEIGNTNAIKLIYSNLGTMYSDLNQLNKSLDYFKKSLKIRQDIGIKDEIAKGLIDIATVLTSLEKPKKAIKVLEEALIIAKNLNANKYLRSCYSLLSQNHELIGNKNKSYEYFDHFLVYERFLQKKDFEEREVLFKKKLNKELKKVETKIQIAKKENIEKQEEISNQKKNLILKEDSIIKINLENILKQKAIDNLNKDKELKKAISEKNRMVRNFIIVAFIFVIFAAILLYKRSKERKKENENLTSKNKEIRNQNLKIEEQKNSIEKKNKGITDSINYAQKIQKAMLPKTSSLEDFLEKSFIFFKPRDIVSGDFYWFSDAQKEKENNNKNSKFLISAVDCTGHGVPGAFMSMIGLNLLNQIVAKKIFEPDKILKELHEGVKTSLQQNRTNNRDGMDMSLCLVDKEKKTLIFSGAKNPLVYIQDEKIYRIRGDKFAIGGFQKEKDRIFKKHIINIEKETTFYIFSDGFPDQIGGEKRRKFLIKRFLELLLKIHKKDMDEQKEILNNVLKKWMRDKYRQVDDILVIGFKI